MSSTVNRRMFIKGSAAAAAGLLIARVSHAQSPVVSEDDPMALSLGYAADHSTVDAAKWTKKAGAGDTQQCTTCALYQAIDGEYGNCPIFAGKRVHAAGWCSGWVGK
ncbi:MAG: high-potential iron-sulfur protein [Congregibacter sp.]